ncbi:MAG: alpha-amylase family glycosyl hydrolase [Chloroflexota bacterium]
MDLPQVNVNNPEVRKYLLDSVRFWLGDVGFDGLRLDYALGPTHDFWTELRATVKQTKPDAWIFGEVVETPTTLLSYEGRLDGCLDFSLEQALRDAFALHRMTISEFASFLIKHERFFPETYSRPSFFRQPRHEPLLLCRRPRQAQAEAGGAVPVYAGWPAHRLQRLRSGGTAAQKHVRSR